MPQTRSSARHSGASSTEKQPEADTSDQAPSAHTKRKAETSASPQSKQSKKGEGRKKQKTIEETIQGHPERDEPGDIEMQEAADEGEGTDRPVGAAEDNEKSANAKLPGHNENGQGDITESKDDKDGEEKQDVKLEGDDASKEQANVSEEQNGISSTANGGQNAIEESEEREKVMPSNILEKGIIYFFTRGRVDVEEPHSVQELQRSYIVLRPLPRGAKLTDGPIEDSKSNRLLILPKKTLPKRPGADRFMTFVEKSHTTIQELKDTFFKGSENETKTRGTRHTPPVTPIGEGVYAITKTGRDSHLAYMLTIPQEIGSVQEEMGLQKKGSFLASTRNPETPPPPYAQLPEGPKFSKEVMEGMGGRRWMPLVPHHLDFEHAQILLIGERDPQKALQPGSKEDEEKKETPDEELLKLENEDEKRIQHLHGDDSIFDDLGISHKEYPKVPTTW